MKPNYRIYDRTGSSTTEDIYAETLDAAIRVGREWIEAADWTPCEYAVRLRCEVGPIVRRDDGSIDEDATWGAEREDCSGFLPPLNPPECIDGGHDWQADHGVVGGIPENPGVWGSGHGAVKYVTCCSRCGLYRRVDHGATDPGTGLQVTSYTYEPADERSRAWLERMAREWVADQLDDEDQDQADRDRPN